MEVVVYSPDHGNFQIFLWSLEAVEVKSGAKEILYVLLSVQGVPVYKLEKSRINKVKHIVVASVQIFQVT